MKKILFYILIVLLLILCIITGWKGFNILGINIIGFQQIQEKNNKLDEIIAEATVLASTDYDKAMGDIQNDIKKLEEQKKTYEDLVSVSMDDEVKTANQYQKYEIEYLWTEIGNLATSEGVVPKIEVLSGIGENTYNLNFTANGSYVGISNFIYNIENDSALGFKIENFSMTPGSSTSDLQATFTCRNIEIKDISSSVINSSSKSETNSTNQDENTINQNIVNTTNSTNTVNTTNEVTTSNVVE